MDFALSPAGGKVISHTQLVPRPDDPGLTTLTQLGAALIPGGKPSVHPMADKVLLCAFGCQSPAFNCKLSPATLCLQCPVLLSSSQRPVIADSRQVCQLVGKSDANPHSRACWY